MSFYKQKTLRLLLLPVVAAFATLMGACGGAGDGGAIQAAAEVRTNVQRVIVETGPAAGVNQLFTTVTVCAPAALAQCETIDHVLVDTGSSGLRLFSSALSPALALSQRTSASGQALVECAQFADGYTWGPVKQADVKLGDTQAHEIAIHIMGDPQFPVPAGCASSGPSQNTVRLFGANGVLGIGPFDHDCGMACSTSAGLQIYFECTGSTCRPTTVALAQQVSNPVSSLPANNNGVLIQLPALERGSASSVVGSLIFGIGTQANNSVDAAHVFNVRQDDGYITTTYKGREFTESFIDSGSNATYFRDSTLAICSSGFYCPVATQELLASLQDSGAVAQLIKFRVGNADSLFVSDPSAAAFDSLAALDPKPDGFTWGLPFFFGRNVFVAIEGRATPSGPGPYFAH
ncbi:DUF3443 domain-containing protein [soil metagenome]